MSEDKIRINHIKAEGDVRTPEYRKGLESAIETYSINDNSFNNNKDDVLRGAEWLLSRYDIDLSFTTEPEGNLFVLAISDAWISTNSVKEKKYLLDILKLVSIKENNAQKLESLSGRVKILSQHGYLSGTMFDPEAESGNSHSEYINMILNYVEKNTDLKLTEEVTIMLNDWSDNSKLQHVRSKLKLTSKENERPLKIVVLDKTAQEMDADLGYDSFFISGSNEPTAVFNRDHKEFDSIEHEYAHSQSDGMTEWY